MPKKTYFTEALFLVAVSALLYWLGFEFQNVLFKFTEFIPGVNWFYLPAGLRVVLVLVADVYGALGIFMATLVIDLLHMEDLRGLSMLSTSLVSGFGPYVAMHLVLRKRGASGKPVLTPFALVQFALVYSLFNAVSHQLVWWYFERQGSFALTDVWPMFVGDLTGALAFLYGWKWVMARKPQPITL